MEKVLVQFPELGSNYLITLETVNNQDEMIVEVELSDLSTDNYIELQKISKAITRQLKDEILVTLESVDYKEEEHSNHVIRSFITSSVRLSIKEER